MSTLNLSQAGRRLSITTPLGTDAVMVTAFNVHEELSRLFTCHLDLISENNEIAAQDIVGQSITLNVESPDGTARYFNGWVTRFAHRGTDDRVTHYRAEVSPWIWFFTRTTNCRIFQNKNVVDIIKAVLTTGGGTDFEVDQIKNPHPVREYCVQYRESDFDFISRLMEDEGIFYYFRHEDEKHTMVMADQVQSYYDCHDSSVDFAAPGAAIDLTDKITSWEHGYEFRSGSFTQRDYNFKTPSTDLTAATNTISKLQGVKGTALYDYPGIYINKSDGLAISKLRMEQVEVTGDVVSASSRCHSFAPGARFTIGSHQTSSEMGKSFVITAIQHTASLAGSATSGTATGTSQDYSNIFECIPDTVAFRPARSTTKPFIRGSQTALVCGPSGQEIHVDEFGRIKVQFYWDRYGVKDENTSCWIRVSQISAGSKWGAFFWPRIGQEVVVSFLEGDPDRPLVTGCVYNAERMPHYALPDQKTKSGIKTNSSPGGGGFNELRFEDKKGKEQIFIHAQRNLDMKVKNTTHETVDGTRHLMVGGDQFEKVGSDKHKTDKHLIVTQDLVEQIDNDKNLIVKGVELTSIEKEQHISVKSDQLEVVEGDSHFTNYGNRNEWVKQNVSTKIGGTLAVTTEKAVYMKGQTVCIEADSSLSLQVGGNFITISSTGVAIQGKMVLINSGGGPGSPLTPTDPTQPLMPDEAKPAAASDDDTAGAVDKNKAATAATITKLTFTKKSSSPTPAAKALQDSAVSGTPFCAICALASAVMG